jgi:hypothetical protein
MQLTDEDIREFSDLWRKEFNETLSPGDARRYASSILELYALLAEPVSPPDSEHTEDTSNDSSL